MDPDFSGRPSFRLVDSVGLAIARVYTVIDCSSLARRTGDGGWRRMVNMHAVNRAGFSAVDLYSAGRAAAG